MPQAAAAAIIAAAGSVGGQIAAGVALADIAWKTVAFSAAFAGATTLVASSLTPKPKGLTESGRTLNLREPTATRRIIYGRTRVGGVTLFAESMPHNGQEHAELQMFIGYAGHEVDGFEEHYYDDTKLILNEGGEVTNQKYMSLGRYIASNIQAHSGHPQQHVGLSAPSWSATDRLQGIAGVRCIFLFSTSAFPKGVPTINSIVRGRRVYDPRTGTTVWSDNAALCIRDYLADPVYGLGATAAELDEASFIAGANICDETVAKADGTAEKRYTLNGVIDTGQQPVDILRSMLTACGGTLVYTGGVWRLYVAAAQAATVTLDEHDIIGSIRVQPRRSRRDLFNGVRGIYVSPVNQYQPADFPPVANAMYRAQDGGEEIWTDIELPFTDSPSMAQRLARIALERNRQQITVQCRCKLTAFRLQAGLWVKLTNRRRGWSQKLFEVQRWQLAQETDEAGNPMLAVDLTLAEIAPGVFDWNSGQETVVDLAPDTALPEPWFVPPPAGLALSSGTGDLLLAGDGTVISRIRVTVQPAPAASVTRYEMQYKRAADTLWTDAAPLTGGEVGFIGPVQDRTVYDVRARSVSTLGVPSGWTLPAAHLVVGKTAPPSDVTGFTASILPYGIGLRWQPVPDADAAGYAIRLGTIWETAAPVAEARGNTHAWEFRSAGTYTLLIKAVDTSGNESGTATPLTVTISGPAAVNPTFIFSGPDYVLGWPEATGQFAVAEYEIREGGTWVGGTLVAAAKATGYRAKVTWGGSRRFWVAAVDVAGNVGPPAAVDVVVLPAGQVASLQPQVIDNNVLLRWTAPATGSLPVDHYLVRRGPSFEGAAAVGQQAGTFATIFEDVAGAYVYWVAAVDTAGNVGAPRSVPATVDQPPDYVLFVDAAPPLGEGTLTNAQVSEGSLFLPVPVETWQEHFASRGWTSPQDQIAAGLPLYIQPATTSGSWAKVIDYGTLLAGTRISVSVASAAVAGEPLASVTISTSADGTAWTDYPGLTQVFATNFRYARIRLDVAATMAQAILAVTEVRVKLDSKLVADAGKGTASAAHAGGTVVGFNRPFIDVRAITVTPSGTAPRIALYDFADTPNPTQFRVLLFDMAGNRVSGPFSWTARGY